MSSVIKIIKDQITDQTREKLNVDVYDSQARAVSEQNVMIGDESARPQWSIGRYELERLSPITVGDFTNYSGKINWSLFAGKKVEIHDIVSNENILVGINVLAKDRLLLPISLLVHDGYTRVYYRSHSIDNTPWIKQEEIYGGSNSIIRIPLTVGWTAIVIVHYTPNAEQDIEISSEFTGIHSWLPLDYMAPNVPIWDTVPITPSINEGQVVNVLRWEKDVTFDVIGNGIYRTMISEVGSTGGYVPNVILNNVAGDKDESVRWFVTSGVGNINSGDKVRLGSSANATSVVSQVYNVKRNPIPNPVFRNSSASWNIYGNGTIKNDKISFVAGSFYHINAQGTNQSHYIESDYISISTGSLYNSIIYYNNNLLNNGEYDLGGYGGIPSRWSFSANVSSAIATRDKMPFMYLLVSGTSDVTARTEDSSLFINGAAASYHISVMASTPKFNRYYVHIVKNSGATLFSSPTLYSTFGYFDSSFTGGTSGTGWGYARVVSLGTSGIATINIGPLSVIAKHTGTYIREYLEYKFYDSGEGQLSISTIDINTGPYVSGQYAAISTSLNVNVSMPTAASFMKIGYHNDVTSISTPLSVDSKVFGFMMAADSDHYNKSIFATEMDWVRTDSDLFTKSTPLDQALYLDQEELIYERTIQGTDIGVIVWTDYNVIMKTEYAYRLDAYDNSQLRNRSTKSAIATIVSGDLTPPKAPSDYTITVGQGFMGHNWTNPTAIDMRLGHIRCYNTSTTATTDIVWEKEVYSPNVSDSYPEAIATTGLQHRYLTAIDRYGNESVNYAYATAQSVAGDFVIVDIFFKDASGDPLDTVNGWFNENVTASVIAESLLGNPVTSLQINISNYDPVSWQGWSEPGYNTFTTEGKYRVRGRAKDAITNTRGEMGLDGIPVRLDKTGPIISDNKALIDHDKSIGGDNYIVLKWDNSLISDSLSGHHKTAIMRAKAPSMVPNPSFEEAKSSSDSSPLGWTGSNSEIYGNDYCNENYSVQVYSNGSIVSSKFSVANEDNLYASVKCKGVSKISLLGTGADGGYSDQIDNQSNYWFQLETNFTTSVGSIYVKLKDNGTGTAYFDELACVINPSFSTIGEVLANNSIFIDKDVNPFEYYLYYLAPIDEAGNIGDVSHYKYLRPFTTYRDKWRNMIRNSSFEKTYEINGTIKAEGWDKYYFSSAFATSSVGINDYEISSGENSYHGLNYFVTNAVIDIIFQNKIHILPYANRYRRFVVSFYAKTPSSSGAHDSKLNLSMLSNNMTSLKSKDITVYTTDSVDWYRNTATFIVDDFDATNFRVALQGYVSETVYWDAIQLEEKYDLPPTDYYDADVMTLEHLQANLIRAYNIEAENIWSGHIIADAITADHIQANSITATHIQANAIDASHIQADTITTDKLNLANADIFISGPELRPLFRRSTTDDHIGNFGLTLATLASGYDGGYGYVGAYIAKTSSDVKVFRIGVFTNTLYEFISISPAAFAGYTDIPKIATSRDYTNGNYEVMLVGNGSNIYGTRFVLNGVSANNRHGIISAGWSTPALLLSTALTKYSILKFSEGNNTFYFSVYKTANTINWYSLTVGSSVSINQSYSFSASGIETGTAHGLAISPSGTFLFCYGANSTLYFSNRTSTNSVNNSFTISTYAGSKSGIGYGNKPNLTHCDIEYIGNDKYIVIYRLKNSNVNYYKSIDGSGNIYIGEEIDLAFLSNDIGYGPGQKQVAPILINSYNYDILVYTTAEMDSVVSTDHYICTGGSKILYKGSTEISLEDLLNTIA